MQGEPVDMIEAEKENSNLTYVWRTMNPKEDDSPETREEVFDQKRSVLDWLRGVELLRTFETLPLKLCACQIQVQ